MRISTDHLLDPDPWELFCQREIPPPTSEGERISAALTQISQALSAIAFEVGNPFS